MLGCQFARLTPDSLPDHASLAQAAGVDCGCPNPMSARARGGRGGLGGAAAHRSCREHRAAVGGTARGPRKLQAELHPIMAHPAALPAPRYPTMCPAPAEMIQLMGGPEGDASGQWNSEGVLEVRAAPAPQAWLGHGPRLAHVTGSGTVDAGLLAAGA